MNQIKFNDDFDWQEVYPHAHAQQTQEIENSGSMMEVPIGTILKNGKVILPSGSKNIHPNHIYIMEKVAELKPKNVFEVGCGYANNLINIHRILPEIEIYGCDISWKQIQTATNRYKECAKFNLIISDFLELNIPANSFDFVFSNAVVMHMSTFKAKETIKKMFHISNKYVLLLDGGVIIPNIENFVKELGGTLDEDLAQKLWGDVYITPPIFIEKK